MLRFSLPRQMLPESSNQSELLGLNLLRLLAQNKISDFHVEVFFAGGFRKRTSVTFARSFPQAQ
jgi:hypothetical protein